jgi:hypothetical protein
VAKEMRGLRHAREIAGDRIDVSRESSHQQALVCVCNEFLEGRRARGEREIRRSDHGEGARRSCGVTGVGHAECGAGVGVVKKGDETAALDEG